ncbi:hypothetical protein [Nocardiopsis flavescens]
MIEDFRRSVADVVEAAQSRPHEVLPLAGTLFQLAGHVPVGERVAALAAIAERLRAPERIALGAVADLAVLCGALVEVGTPAGAAGVEITRRAREVGGQALRFADAWEGTGEDAPPHPRETGESHRARVAPVLGDGAMYALASWATMQPYGIAVRAVLGDAEVRAALREDPRGLSELLVLSSRMSRHVEEFGEVHELLLLAETDRMLVLDRASGRAFRVRFDGVGDNFQLHTLLADALIGPEGRGVPGQRPMPDWVASATDLRDDPRLSIVEGEWDLVGGDGTWVGNEQTPGSVPLVDGERVLVLEQISLKHTWRTGRRHPHITGWLRVEEELGRDEAAAWWGRMHPAGVVVHPLVQSQEETSPVVGVPPEELSGAWDPAGPPPAPGAPDGQGGTDPWTPQAPADPGADDASWGAVRASGPSDASGGWPSADVGGGAPGAPGHGGPVGAPSGGWSSADAGGGSGVPGAASGGWPAAGAGGGAPGASGHGGSAGTGAPSGGWPSADVGGGAPGYGDSAAGQGEPSGGWPAAGAGGGGSGAAGASGHGGSTGAGLSSGGWPAADAGGGAPGYGDSAAGQGAASGGWPAAGTGGGPGAAGASAAPGHGGSAGPGSSSGGRPSADVGGGTPGARPDTGGWQPADTGAGHGGPTGAQRAYGNETAAGVHGAPAGALAAQGSWDAFGGGAQAAPPGASLVPPPPADRWEVEAEPSIAEGPGTDREPPGAGLLEPMPEGVSDSSGWGPSWKS